tara:strand:+ start:183 stop:749 length:567 start_codon:yes stop_codon:yes gene_type:complete
MVEIHLISNKLNNKIFNRINDIKLFNSIDNLTGGDLLISYSNGKIIPTEVLLKYEIKINFHCGPLEYPGPDPHHWACYEKSKFYGGVCHLMNAKPDNGEIIKSLKTQIANKLNPLEIDIIGEKSINMLFLSMVDNINSLQISPNKEKWIGKYKSRKDLISMCDFSGLNKFEIEHRKFAFSGFEKYFKY